MENNMKHCPGCSKHCPENALNCGKGHAYFKNRKGHVHHTSKGGLLDYFMQSSHYLFHFLHDGQENEDTLFSALSETERSLLEQLLIKLLNSWKK